MTGVFGKPKGKEEGGKDKENNEGMTTITSTTGKFKGGYYTLTRKRMKSKKRIHTRKMKDRKN